MIFLEDGLPGFVETINLGPELSDCRGCRSYKADGVPL